MKETNQKYNVLTAEEERVIVYKGTHSNPLHNAY